MTLTHACAVAAPDDVAGVRVLAAALALHHPGVTLTVAALPGARRLLEDVDGIAVITFAELDAPEAAAIPGLLSTPALAALARPLLLRRALAGGAEDVLLLAADCDVRAPLGDLAGSAEVVLFPRIDGRLPDDGERPDADDLAAAGEIDDELLALRDGPSSTRFVDWWLERIVGALRDAAPASPPRSALSPLAAAERALDGIVVLDDAGVGVSAWNLHERPLTDRGEPRAAGSPLRLMRFAGFRPDRPWWLSQTASRARVLDDPALARLCRERAAALLDAGWTSPPGGDVDEIALALELRLDERMRRLLLEAADAGEDFGDLSEPAGAAALLRWLAEPARSGAAAGLNRYSHDVWRAREDLQRAYPELDGDDADGYVGWLWVHGRTELGLDARLLPPAPAWVDTADRSVPAVEVLGYLRGNLGLGEAARGYVRALRAANVPVATYTVALDGPLDHRGVARRRTDELEFEDLFADVDAEVILACVNAPQLPGLVADVGEERFAGRYIIGQWAWETDVVPDYWSPGFDLVDEVWVPSTWVADLLSVESPVPVVAVPHPIEAPDRIADDHGLEFPPGDYTFLFAFDFLSTLQRKNPLGLIEAFKMAFTPGEGPRLVLKTTNARFRPELRDQLRFACDGRVDIAIADATLQPPEMAALFAQADCYVSLHRSEGFGLTLAESMILGKPVIATGYSGNLDFMRPANSHLVDYELTDVGPEGEHYPADGRWAEPSLEHAATLMRTVWSDREAACALGERARRDVETQLHPAAVGAIARRRLEHLPGRRADGVPASPPPFPIGDLERRLHFDLAHGVGAAPTGPRGVAKRSAMRAMRPYTQAERHLDEALVVSIRRLQAELERLGAARERDRDRIARLERRLRRSG